MNCKVLHYLNGCDEPDEYKSVMSTYVFKEDTDLDFVEKRVQEIWEENDGNIGYYDIIEEHFGDCLLCVVVEEKSVIW